MKVCRTGSLSRIATFCINDVECWVLLREVVI